MNNKYFIPEIEDICIGYICVEETVIGWEEVVVKDECSDFDPCRAISFLRQGKLKTPYLTKEQIEIVLNEQDLLLDWEEGKIYTYYKIDTFKHIWFKNNEIVSTIWVKHINANNNEHNDVPFKIKSVNEFRKLLKMLEI